MQIRKGKLDKGYEMRFMSSLVRAALDMDSKAFLGND